jgi:hypothetical protein
MNVKYFYPLREVSLTGPDSPGVDLDSWKHEGSNSRLQSTFMQNFKETVEIFSRARTRVDSMQEQ